MDRIHRLGQHRPVRAIKLVIEDSIESRIVQVSDSGFCLHHTDLLTPYPVAREEVGYDQCYFINR